MSSQKYSVNQHLIETLLSWVKSGEIAIPEIQRPFVWDASKVRDLMDSLYQGYPVGYIIAWRNPNVKLKDGSVAEGKKVLIDGQQRVTALRAALAGEQVINQDYKQIRIRIAFQPIEERFEVANPAIDKDKTWFPDIAPIINGEFKTHNVAREYLKANPEADEDLVYDRLGKLTDIVKKQVGLIELAPDLDIETVTEIFIRINSKGVVLSQADFAMSKIAVNEEFDGNTIRKAIDYFCHLAIAPEFYPHIEQNDLEFAKTDYFAGMKWLRKENDDLYPKHIHAGSTRGSDSSGVNPSLPPSVGDSLVSNEKELLAVTTYPSFLPHLHLHHHIKCLTPPHPLLATSYRPPQARHPTCCSAKSAF